MDEEDWRILAKRNYKKINHVKSLETKLSQIKILFERLNIPLESAEERIIKP